MLIKYFYRFECIFSIFCSSEAFLHFNFFLYVYFKLRIPNLILIPNIKGIKVKN